MEVDGVTLEQVAADVGSQSSDAPPTADDIFRDALETSEDTKTSKAGVEFGRWDCCFVVEAPDWHKECAPHPDDGHVERSAKVPNKLGILEDEVGEELDVVKEKIGELSGLLKKPRHKMSLDALLVRLSDSGLDHFCFRSVQGDEIYVKVRASLERLKRHAEAGGARFRLAERVVEERARRGFPQFGIKPIKIGSQCNGEKMRPYEHIYARYDTHPDLAEIYDVPPAEKQSGWPFSSMMRAKLIWDLIHAKRDNGGCQLDIVDLTYNGDILAFLALHDAAERRALDNHFCKMSWLRLPTRLPLDRYMGYFGELHGLRMSFTAHITTCYYSLALIGLAIFIETLVVEDSGTTAVIAYSFLLVIWSIVVIEDWKRRQAALSVMWGTRGFEDHEKDWRRPGYITASPVDGRKEIWYPPSERRKHVHMSILVVCAMVLADLAFLYVVFWLKAKQPGKLKSMSHDAFNYVTSVVNALGIQFFFALFKIVAVQCTDRENWRTETQYHDALTQKMFYFYIVNYYAPLYYLTFVQYYANPFTSNAKARGTDGDHDNSYDSVAQQVIGELRVTVIIVLAVALFSQNFGRVVLPFFMETWQKHSEGGLKTEMSVAELQYILQEYDEVLDTTYDYMLTTMQYGYIILFSVAFPGAPFVALVVNNVQMRADCYAFLHLYRRIMPASAEDIGVFEQFFQMLNVAGIVTNTAISIYVMETFNRDAGYSNHHRDTLFIAITTVWFTAYATLRLLIDDVPDYVDVQIRRQAFIDSKIIDKLADVDTRERLEQHVDVDYRVAHRDDGPYFANLLLYREDEHNKLLLRQHEDRNLADDPALRASDREG